MASRIRRFASFGLAMTAALAMAGTPAAIACTPSENDALIILDASDSMLRYAGTAISRFNVAKQSIKSALALFPDDALIALRLYGSQERVEREVCTDTVLAVPFAPAAANRQQIDAVLGAARARGKTPISHALEQAAADFPERATRNIVLVSDGRESCFGDPCATANVLAKRGFRINTIGFQADRLGVLQLQCIAAATGGRYFNAPVAIQLTNRLMDALGVCTVAANDRLRWPHSGMAPG